MGNWRRAMIEGTCPRDQVAELAGAVTMNLQTFENFHCLAHGAGICGMPMWAAETISAVGNLAERGYDEESVAETLEDLAKVAPGLEVKVHLGGDNEIDDCVATIALNDGKAETVDPEREKLPEIGDAQMKGHLFDALRPRF